MCYGLEYAPGLLKETLPLCSLLLLLLLLFLSYNLLLVLQLKQHFSGELSPAFPQQHLSWAAKPLSLEPYGQVPVLTKAEVCCLRSSAFKQRHIWLPSAVLYGCDRACSTFLKHVNTPAWPLTCFCAGALCRAMWASRGCIAILYAPEIPVQPLLAQLYHTYSFLLSCETFLGPWSFWSTWSLDSSHPFSGQYVAPTAGWGRRYWFAEVAEELKCLRPVTFREALSLLCASLRSQQARADLRKKLLLNSSTGLNVIPNTSNLQPHLNWGIEGEIKG